jgi:hypothetical protein
MTFCRWCNFIQTGRIFACYVILIIVKNRRYLAQEAKNWEEKLFVLMSKNSKCLA